jgi:predicted negative regulator of RcsB-dependent stress response
MTIPPPAGNPPPEQPVIVEPGFEVAVQSFWEKNRRLILTACAVALLAIVGREGWQYLEAEREQEVRGEYARASGQPERLAAFAAANANHALAGVAYLQIADSKYAAADYKQAAENYKKASAVIKNSILLGRAKLGAAMSQLNGGEQPAAESALKAISSDAALPRAARAEAAYHLATLAQEAGNAAEVARLVGEINKIDASGAWAQRAASLLGSPARS